MEGSLYISRELKQSENLIKFFVLDFFKMKVDCIGKLRSKGEFNTKFVKVVKHKKIYQIFLLFFIYLFFYVGIYKEKNFKEKIYKERVVYG